jgi:hypothetical protein
MKETPMKTTKRFSVANVTSVVALFVALGGTAWALGANSVGSKQLKTSAVTTKKIKNEAVTAPKLQTDLLKGGPAYWMAKSEQLLLDPPAEYQTVATLGPLPAGSYLVSGHADAVKFDSAEFIRCLVRVDGEDYQQASARVGTGATNGSWVSGITATAAVTSPTLFDAELRCRVDSDAGDTPYVEGLHMEAVSTRNLIELPE